MPNNNIAVAMQADRSKILHRKLISDGFCLEALSPDIKTPYNRSPDHFWNKKGVPANEIVKKQAMRFGFKTSVAGTIFEIVIVPGHILRSDPYLSDKQNGLVEIADLNALMVEQGYRYAPQEIGYHLCRLPDCDLIMAYMHVYKLIVMNVPFNDHEGEPSRWCVDFVEDPDENERGTACLRAGKKYLKKELNLADGREYCNRSIEGPVLFRNDAFVFLDRAPVQSPPPDSNIVSFA